MTRIAIPTTTRADWGVLEPLATALENVGLATDILVSGTHLSKAFGHTIDEIYESGHNVAKCIPILNANDSVLGETNTMAQALLGFGEYFSQAEPDAVVALGDRYEMLAIAEAAFLARIPIFHISGGDVTKGAIDDAIRHCLTKLSVLHFASTDSYRNRVIQLGENPDRVFNVGALGVENAKNIPVMSKQEFADSIGLKSIGDYVVMTYHPVTAEASNPLEEVGMVLDAIESFGELEIIATKSNADAGGRAINSYLEQRAQINPRLFLFDSLGSFRYLNALRYAKAVIGNSSSGILEAPAVGTPTVNVGNRQEGRVKPESVIDCALNYEAIRSAITLSMSGDFTERCFKAPNPYGAGHTSEIIANIIQRIFKDEIKLDNDFYDLDIGGIGD